MSYIIVDVEADGECPGLFSMTELGAVYLNRALDTTFYANFRPISSNFNPEALRVTKKTRLETLEFAEPKEAMQEFYSWIKKLPKSRRLFFVSDNNGFDWAFVNYYFWRFLGHNPFGHSSMNLGSFYKGLVRNPHAGFKHMRITKHTHNPVDDAMGNAEAMIKMIDEFNLSIELE